jgi:hypothetical protein
MGRRSPQGHQAYDASGRKTFKSALCHLLQTEFPGSFGPQVTTLFADQVNSLFEQFHPPGDRFKIGQVLWVGVAIDDPPTRSKRIEDTKLVPVVLDLVIGQDIEDMRATGRRLKVRRDKIVRLFRQAHDQNAVLTLADVSLLMNSDTGTVSREVLKHEKETGETVPRRGTVHDLGPSVTHKSIICYKCLVERKPTSQVAQETFHSPREVEYYVQCFRRIQLCRDSGMSKEDIALATGHSVFLVQEYLDLMKEFGLPPLPNPAGKDGVTSGEVRKTSEDPE